MSSYARKQIFWFMTLIDLKDLKEDLEGDWLQVPQSKNSFWSVFEVGSSSHLIQHVKLFTCTNFHACIIKFTIRPIFEVKQLHCFEPL